MSLPRVSIADAWRTKLGAASSRLLLGAVIACGVLVLSACGASSERPNTSSPQPSPSPPRAALPGVAVKFQAADGVHLAGRLFGNGRIGIVLAHMGNPGDTQADWFAMARALADRGYTALTYNRRGNCNVSGDECSDGSDYSADGWKDVVGASTFLRSKGAPRIVLVGASLGAMSALHAAVTERVEAAALIEIGGVNHASGYEFSRRELQRLDGAKLFVSSAGDPYGGADAARQWHAWAREPKQLEILSGYEHGTDMLREGQPTAGPLTRVLLRFLTREVPP